MPPKFLCPWMKGGMRKMIMMVMMSDDIPLKELIQKPSVLLEFSK